MKIVVLGAKGMLGHDITNSLKKKHTVTALTRNDIDITSPKSIKMALDPYSSSDYLINCAAYTKVDTCETKQEEAFSVNGHGPKELARFCEVNNIHIIHFSTDYVFNGERDRPYLESDPTNPINIYGQSKLLGEQAVLNSPAKSTVFRVQWLYGQNGHNFIQSIHHLSTKKKELFIVNDQWGSPSSTLDLAYYLSKILDIHATDLKQGIFHFRNEGYTTWFDYAQFILNHLNIKIPVYPCNSEQFKQPAPRPKNGRLSNEKLKKIYIPLPDWKSSTRSFLNLLQN